MEIKQKQAYEYFAPKLKDFLIQKGYSPSDFKDEEKYKLSFINYKNEIDNHLNYKNFTSEELIEMCRFMGMEFITGTFILSTTIKIILNSPRYILNSIFFLLGMEKRIYF